MAKEIALLTPDAGDAIDPGQDPGVFERAERDAYRVTAAFGGRSDLLVAWEAPPASVGAVEAPQERSEHP